MSKQLNYIISAFLLLLVFSGLFLVVKNIPSKDAEHESSTVTVVTKSIPVISPTAEKGNILFQSRCAACHALFKDDGDMVGVVGFIEREPWTKRQNVYDFIRDPGAFYKKSGYKPKMPEVEMQSSPDLTDQEIDAVVEYIKYVEEVRRLPIPLAER